MTRVQGRAALPVLAKVFASLGLAFLVVAAVWAGLRMVSIADLAHADGTVVDLRDGGRSLRPVVQFSPPGGSPVQFESLIGSSPPRYAIGDRVGVRYAPDDPSDAVIVAFWELWFFPMLAALIGGPFAVVGGVLYVVSRVSGRGQPHSAGGPPR